MQHFFLVLSIILTSLFCQAQNSGFMGKKISIGYGINTSPAFFGSNAQNQSIIGNAGSAETGVLALNAIHEGFIDYVISPKWIMGCSVRYYKTTYDNSKKVALIYTKNYVTDDIRPSGYYDITGLTYTLYFKYFGKRYVAPWGHYMMFGPTLNTATTEYNSSIMNIDGKVFRNGTYEKDTSIADFGPKIQKFKGVNLMLGYGRTRIFGKRVSLDYGFNIHSFSAIALIYDLAEQNPENLFEGLIGNSNNYIPSTVKKRIRGVNRINAFVKIGILLF